MQMRRVVSLLLLVLALVLAGCTMDKVVMDGAVENNISGKVVSEDGSPISGAYVYAYRSAAKGQMGPSDYISNPTEENGSFSFNVALDEYKVIARKRADGSNVGVLNTGDYTSQAVTVDIKENRDKKIKIEMTKIVEPMFFKKTGAEVTDTGIKGSILDASGKPVAGAFAIAYKAVGMKTLPDFASLPTRADGSFTLYLPEGGRYYIGARVNTKRPPVEGELYGTYDKNADHSIEVSGKSFVENIKISLKPFAGNAQSDFKGFK